MKSDDDISDMLDNEGFIAVQAQGEFNMGLVQDLAAEVAKRMQPSPTSPGKAMNTKWTQTGRVFFRPGILHNLSGLAAEVSKHGPLTVDAMQLAALIIELVAGDMRR